MIVLFAFAIHTPDFAIVVHSSFSGAIFVVLSHSLTHLPTSYFTLKTSPKHRIHNVIISLRIDSLRCHCRQSLEQCSTMGRGGSTPRRGRNQSERVMIGNEKGKNVPDC